MALSISLALSLFLLYDVYTYPRVSRDPEKEDALN